MLRVYRALSFNIRLKKYYHLSSAPVQVFCKFSCITLIFTCSRSSVTYFYEEDKESSSDFIFSMLSTSRKQIFEPRQYSKYCLCYLWIYCHLL